MLHCVQCVLSHGARCATLISVPYLASVCLCPAGPAAQSSLLPADRRAKVNPARNSQLYAKAMEAPDEVGKPPGKRIGF